jgi:hydrogenase nickel incorporation protein HypA/HybF
MHEMSVARGLLDIIHEKANNRKVADVYLRVGPISCVFPDHLETCFAHMAKGTIAAQAKLHFEKSPLVLKCRTCGVNIEHPMQVNLKLNQMLSMAFKQGCKCGSKELEVLSRAECSVESLTLK